MQSRRIIDTARDHFVECRLNARNYSRIRFGSSNKPGPRQRGLSPGGRWYGKLPSPPTRWIRVPKPASSLYQARAQLRGSIAIADHDNLAHLKSMMRMIAVWRAATMQRPLAFLIASHQAKKLDGVGWRPVAAEFLKQIVDRHIDSLGIRP